MDKKQYMGVFDSGIGGLNVLNNLVEEFPNENFLYVGDNLNVPYGIKTKEQLEEIISKIFTFMQNSKKFLLRRRFISQTGPAPDTEYADAHTPEQSRSGLWACGSGSPAASGTARTHPPA